MMYRGEINKQPDGRAHPFGQTMVPLYTWRALSSDAVVAHFNNLLKVVRFYEKFDGTIRRLGEGGGDPDYRDPSILEGLEQVGHIMRRVRGED